MKILYMGDSITDVGRNTTHGSLVSIGQGYALMTAARLAADHPEKFTFVNNGISGHRVVDLYARIKVDVWNHAPDVLSILVGVNDVWHEIMYQNGVDAERFEHVLHMFVSETQQRFPNIKIILMEPFVLKAAATEGAWEAFMTETKLRGEAVRRVAQDCGAFYLPLQELLDQACERAPESYWLGDGVHPTPAGHQLIADAWLELFRKEILA